MEWLNLITATRLGLEERESFSGKKERTQFQRDYDRIIFSSPFRRMQNKTQIFPLPDRIFVHNRLTHSLEVASVGRSLGNLVSDIIYQKEKIQYNPLISEIGTIVSTACLAHDLGNPPFGHSGEAAISTFFRKGYGQTFKKQLTIEEWSDFINFDGNANAFRTLANQFHGKRQGGFALTYPTLAAIVKYPYESIKTDKQKFGFFQSEKEIYLKIAKTLNIPEKSEGLYARHPLVFLVEAADDICYQIMDMEDAYKLGIISYDEVYTRFLDFYSLKEDKKILERITKTLKVVTDPNEQISYIRAGVIGKLVSLCVDIFEKNYSSIMEGNFSGSLIKKLPEKQNQAMEEIRTFSFSRIYNHRSVVEIEIAGYKIIGTLLEEFINALMFPEEPLSLKIISLFPLQYNPRKKTTYNLIQAVIDFVSGMTDVYALDLYRKIKGISLPGGV